VTPFSHYHRTISSTDPHAHLYKDTNPTPALVQFSLQIFNNDENCSLLEFFGRGEGRGRGVLNDEF